jgi:hypothetical protein
MAANAGIPIRSYRVCFKVERRIHKIDRWRIPLPFGVPVRGAGYALALLAAVLVGGQLPLLGLFVSALPIPVRFVLLPIGGAYALSQWQIDGRPAHATAIAWSRMWLSPRRIAAFRRAPSPGVVRFSGLTIAPDERTAQTRRAVIHGPAAIVLRYPFEARQRGNTLRLVPQPGPASWRGKRVRVDRGQRVVIG